MYEDDYSWYWSSLVSQKESYNGSDNQKWRLQSVGNGYYTIISKYKNAVLTATNMYEDDYSWYWSSLVSQKESYNGSNNQKWTIYQLKEKTGSVTYQYSGEYCKYDLKLSYYGKAPIKIYINNVKFDDWYANQTGSGVSNPLITRVLKNIFLNTGDKIKIESFIQGDEFVCIDKLELTSLIPKVTVTDKGKLVNLNYNYDLNGNITKINGDYYDYDGINRLIWAGNVPTRNDVTVKSYARGSAWSYDGAGNMTGKQSYQNGQLQQSITLGYDLANRLLSSGTAAYTNGNVGERLTKTQGSEFWSYLYDGEARLKSVSKNGSILAESNYDGSGIRYKKISNGKTTYYIYSGSNVIAEYTPADGKYKYYIYAGKRSIAEEKDGNKTFYHRDHLGSTRALTDQNKKLVGLSKYNAWGKLESTNEYDEGVINGDMELAEAGIIKNWQAINVQQTSSDCSYSANAGLNGSAAIKIARSTVNPNAAWSLKNLFTSPDTDYLLTGFYLSGDSNSTKAKVQLVYYDATGNLITTHDTGILGYSGTEWKQFTLSSRSPTNAATMEIRLTADSDAGMSYSFDGIRLKIPGLQNQDMFDYTGKKEDEGTGLKYFGARFYDPETARFLTADTYTFLPNDVRIMSGLSDGIIAIGLSNPQKQNIYAYCTNNPIRYIDPSGHFSYDPYGDYIQSKVDAFVQYCGYFYADFSQAFSFFVEFVDKGTQTSIRASTDVNKPISATFGTKGSPYGVKGEVIISKDGVRFDGKGTYKAGRLETDTKGNVKISGDVVSYTYNARTGDYTLKVLVGDSGKGRTYVGVTVNPTEFQEWYDTYIDDGEDENE